MEPLLWAYRVHINFRNVCLESRDVITFPSSINPNMQMNALLNLAQATEVYLIFHSCERQGKKKKEKEMAKTNKNTHNAPVWTLRRFCIITLRSTLPAHLPLPVSAAYRHTQVHRHTHTRFLFFFFLSNTQSHNPPFSFFSLAHPYTFTYTHTHTNT